MMLRRKLAMGILPQMIVPEKLPARCLINAVAAALHCTALLSSSNIGA